MSVDASTLLELAQLRVRVAELEKDYAFYKDRADNRDEWLDDIAKAAWGPNALAVFPLRDLVDRVKALVAMEAREEQPAPAPPAKPKGFEFL